MQATLQEIAREDVYDYLQFVTHGGVRDPPSRPQQPAALALLRLAAPAAHEQRPSRRRSDVLARLSAPSLPAQCPRLMRAPRARPPPKRFAWPAARFACQPPARYRPASSHACGGVSRSAWLLETHLTLPSEAAEAVLLNAGEVTEAEASEEGCADAGMQVRGSLCALARCCDWPGASLCPLVCVQPLSGAALHVVETPRTGVNVTSSVVTPRGTDAYRCAWRLCAAVPVSECLCVESAPDLRAYACSVLGERFDAPAAVPAQLVAAHGDQRVPVACGIAFHAHRHRH